MSYKVKESLHNESSAAELGKATAADPAVTPDQPMARMTARDALRARAQRLRDEAEGLECLAKSLPDDLPQRADLALWSLAHPSRIGS